MMGIEEEWRSVACMRIELVSDSCFAGRRCHENWTCGKELEGEQ